jgi:hypothetical protein
VGNAFAVLVTKLKVTFGRDCVGGDNIKMNFQEIVSDSVDRIIWLKTGVTGGVFTY